MGPPTPQATSLASSSVSVRQSLCCPACCSGHLQWRGRAAYVPAAWTYRFSQGHPRACVCSLALYRCVRNYRRPSAGAPYPPRFARLALKTIWKCIGPPRKDTVCGLLLCEARIIKPVDANALTATPLNGHAGQEIGDRIVSELAAKGDGSAITVGPASRRDDHGRGPHSGSDSARSMGRKLLGSRISRAPAP